MKKLSNDETAFFCRELSLLLHSGVGAEEGLELLRDEAIDGKDTELLDGMLEILGKGMSLAEAMGEAKCFPEYAVSLVKTGEYTGRLEETLDALAERCENQSRIEQQIKNAMLYPSILMFMMLAVIVVLLTKVLPVFDDVYASVGGSLTGVAGGLLLLGEVLNKAMPVIFVLLAAAVVFIVLFSVSDGFREKILAVWQSKRGDRGIMGALHTAEFASALSMGISSGLPVEEAFDMAAVLEAQTPAQKRKTEACRQRLDKGEDLAAALGGSGLLPPAECRMLALGFKSGRSDTVMEQIADRLMRDAQDSIERAVSRVEPIMVIVTSVLVGAILLSVMLPLMNIMTAIG